MRHYTKKQIYLLGTKEMNTWDQAVYLVNSTATYNTGLVAALIMINLKQNKHQ